MGLSDAPVLSTCLHFSGRLLDAEMRPEAQAALSSYIPVLLVLREIAVRIRIKIRQRLPLGYSALESDF